MKKKDTLYIFIDDHSCRTNERGRHIDYIVFYGDNSCHGLMNEKPNVKAMIDKVTSKNKQKYCCGTCYNRV